MLKLKFPLLQIGKFRMDYALRKARLLAKTKMSCGNKTPRKAQVMVMVRKGNLAALLSAGDEGLSRADQEAGQEEREGRPGECLDRVDQGLQEGGQDDLKCKGGEAA